MLCIFTVFILSVKKPALHTELFVNRDIFHLSHPFNLLPFQSLHWSLQNIHGLLLCFECDIVQKYHFLNFLYCLSVFHSNEQTLRFLLSVPFKVWFIFSGTTFKSHENIFFFLFIERSNVLLGTIAILVISRQFNYLLVKLDKYFLTITQQRPNECMNCLTLKMTHIEKHPLLTYHYILML